VSGGGLARHVNGILGLLCKTHFPGLVQYASKREPTYTFDHYANAPNVEADNKAVRVKRDFWVSLHRTTLLNTSYSLDFS
jgi:hypothetical protein